MPTHLGGVQHITGLAVVSGGSTVLGQIKFKQPTNASVGTALAGYVSPNLQSISISHKADVENVPNQAGRTGALIASEEYVEITFDFIPEGTSGANALASAALPQPLSRADIWGLPVIQIGSFADGLNTLGPDGAADAASTQPWIYMGDGGADGKPKEKWNGKITLRRYLDIPKTATYTIV